MPWGPHRGSNAVTRGTEKPHGMALQVVYRAGNRCKASGPPAGAFPKPSGAGVSRGAAQNRRFPVILRSYTNKEKPKNQFDCFGVAEVPWGPDRGLKWNKKRCGGWGTFVSRRAFGSRRLLLPPRLVSRRSGKPQNQTSGWPKAGRRTDFDAVPTRIRPKSGPEARFPVRKHYCFTQGTAATFALSCRQLGERPCSIL